jgi:hypothetical protein
MSSTGINSGYLYRCSKRAESFSVTLCSPVERRFVRKLPVLPSERYKLQGIGDCVKDFVSRRWQRRYRKGPLWNAVQIRFRPRKPGLRSCIELLPRCVSVRYVLFLRDRQQFAPLSGCGHSWARAVSPCCVMARSSRRSQSADSSQNARMCREVICAFE